MSIPKKIRETYEDTFKKLINTSESSKKLRQVLSQMHKPAPTLNLPIRLTDLRINLFSSPKLANEENKPSKRKLTKADELKQPPSKKARRK